MLSQKYIKSKLDCIEDKLCEIEKSSSIVNKSKIDLTETNSLLEQIDTVIDSTISNDFQVFTYNNPSAVNFSTFKEISFVVLSGTIDVEIIPDGGGFTSNIAYPLGTTNTVIGDTFNCDTESKFSVQFTGTGNIYIKIKKQ